ncbi:MAG: hypothetical protein ACQUHE_11495 [Bacteroidia bacterium]
MALWYQWRAPAKGGSSDAKVELHVNLWRLSASPTLRRRVANFWYKTKRRVSWKEIPIVSNDVNFLDIGILFKDSSSLASFSLYIPGKIQQEDIEDLGVKLKKQKILMAVFNEPLVAVEGEGSESFVINNSLGAPTILCHPIKPGRDTTIGISNSQTYGEATIISFGGSLRSRFDEKLKNYIRFRINLSHEVASNFVTEELSQDRAFQSSFKRDEVVEFRLNEQRSLPPDIAQRAEPGDQAHFAIDAIHYFVIRDTQWDLVLSQGKENKVRLMEQDLWDEYAFSGKPKEFRKRRHFIYHWKEKSVGGNPITDYNALAKFRRSDTGIPRYVLWVIFGGALGSTSASILWESFLKCWLGF